MRRKPSLLILLLLCSVASVAQQTWKPDEVLLRLSSEASIDDVQRDLLRRLPAGTSMKGFEPLGHSGRYHRLVFQGAGLNVQDLEGSVAHIAGVEATSLNYQVRYNAQPSCVPVPGAVQVGGDRDDGDAAKQRAVILTVLALEDSEVGTAHYIAKQGSSVIEGDIVLTFDQVSFGEAQICLGPGCFSITIVEVDVALSQDSYIQTGPGLGRQQFLTSDGFFGSAGTPDVELCDSLDNDRDGVVDEDFLWYTDADGDGLGVTSTEQFSCTPLLGAVQIGGDRNDADTNLTTVGAPCNEGDTGAVADIVRANCTCLGFPQGACPAGEIVDHNGNCAPTVRLGDRVCDDRSLEHNAKPIFFNCALFLNDGGDCGSVRLNEICNGAGNDRNGLVDEGFTTALSCAADTLITAPAFACAVSVDYPIPNATGCADVSITRLSGPPSGGLFTVGTTPVLFGMQLAGAPGPVVLNEDFSDNGGGWMLDAEWAIGQATASACAATCAGNDPGVDNTPTADNGVAGMNVGGCVTTSLHGFRYVTSPTVDASGGDSLTLRFHRHLHGDHAPFMQHVVQVFDGSTWVTIWSHVPQTCINDAAWTPQEFDVTAYRNTAFAVRFGQSVTQGGAFSSGGWNVDDVLLFNDLPYADTCSFNVTVVPAATDASLPCGSAINFTTDEGSCATNSVQLEFPGTFFSCTLDTLFHNAPASFPLGTTSFHWIAVHVDLSTDTCTQSVTVEDDEVPVITCAPTLDLVADAQSCAATNVVLSAPIATDNCTLQSLSNDHSSSTYHSGTTIVTWTATDGSGNTSTCTQMVNVVGNSGEPPVLSCSPDTVLSLDTQLCGAQYTYEQPTLLSNCIAIPLPLISGPVSGSTFAPGTTQVSFAYTGELLNEDFRDNSNGWSLDAEWMIGTASTSFCAAACTGNDPGTDHTATADQGLAGMNIGGCVSTSSHAFRYLTSPPMDASNAGALTVEFWRHLHGDHSPFMQHRVQVFDGLAWVTIWEHAPQTCLNDADWTLRSFDVTAYKNPLFRVRFGKAVAAGGAFTSGGWSVDDVRIFDPASGPPVACSFLVSVEGPSYWYADLDGDGYGVNTDSTAACAPPIGYVGNTLDCNDACSACNPDMLEECDGFDNDCDGLVDEGCSVSIAARVFLEGPYNEALGTMNDGMRALGLVPTVEPYSGLGYAHVGGGGEMTTPAVLANTGNDAIVDWVVLELRDESSPSTVVSSRCALVQRDGEVVDVDGLSPMQFAMVPGNYHVAVRHRNHLGCMTTDALALSTSVATVDLTAAATVTYGTDARKASAEATPVLQLWAGDVTFDHIVKYTGQTNDRDPILLTIGGFVPTNTTIGYHASDVNLDGTVKYTGSLNDRDPILLTIGGVLPTNVRMEQLP